MFCRMLAWTLGTAFLWTAGALATADTTGVARLTAFELKKSGRPVLKELLNCGIDPRVSRKVSESPVSSPPSTLVQQGVQIPIGPRTLGLRGQAVTVYPNIQMHPSATTQSEMSIATDPVNPNVVLVGANAARISIGAVSQGWYHTTDGGANWMGGDTLPTHSDLTLFMADPAVGIDLGGNLFFNAIIYNAAFGDVIVAKSANGGTNWTQAAVPNPSIGEDKDHFTLDVNPSSPFAGYLYTAYTDFDFLVPPISFSRSTDGGTSFSKPVSISGDIGSLFAQGINLAVGPEGELYAVWSGYDVFPIIFESDSTRLGFNKSTDGGATWQVAKSIRRVADIRGSLDKGGNFVRVNSFPSMAVDRSAGPRRGWIYVVYAEKAPTSPVTTDVFLIRSTDGGDTWSNPRKVSQETSVTDQWFPAIAVDPATGVLYVDYYDSRNFADDSAQVYVSASGDGGDTFEDVLVSDQAFLPVPVPGLATGYMGDYIGIAAVNGTVWPSWNDNRTGIHQAYTAKMVFSAVGFPPKISVFPDSLDFGTAFIGYSDTLQAVVRNLGFPDTLVVAGISSDNPQFVPDVDSFSLPGGMLRRVKVAFTPSGVGPASAHLTIQSNDPDRPTVVLTLQGSGEIPPELVLLPDSFRIDLMTGESKAETLLISNPGSSNLTFRISRKTVGLPASANFMAAPLPDAAQIIAAGQPVPLEELGTNRAIFPESMLVGPDGLMDNDLSHSFPFGLSSPSIVSAGLAAESVQVFGGPQFATAPFGPLSRGNLFFCTDSSNLVEHRFYLKTFGPTELWFLVYEGKLGEPPYYYSVAHLVSAANASPAGPGQGWYSSGEVNVPLVPENYYLILAQWREPCTRYYQTDISPFPVPTSFGFLKGPVGFSGWQPLLDFPPYTTIPVNWLSPLNAGAVAFYQTLVNGAGTSWLAASVDTGTVPPGGSLALPIVFDATAFGSPSVGAGDYFADLVVSSNAPGAPADTVVVHLHLTAAPNLAFASDSLDFGEAYVGFPDTLPFVVSNNGAETLRVSGISTSNPRFMLLDSPVFDLLPGQSRPLQVHFLPTGLGIETAALSISSNDPNEPVKNGLLTGTAIHPPALSSAPDSFALTLNQGKSLAATLSLQNAGLGNLAFSLHVSPRPKVLLLSSDAFEPQIGDVQSKLLATGRFSVVDTIQFRFVDLPTIDQLRQYDAVLIWSSLPFYQPTPAAVGDLLANYVDMGGGVVTALSAMANDPRFPPGSMIEGRFNAENYWALQPGRLKQGRATLGTVHLPDHPTIQGVKLFDGGELSDRLQGGTVALGGTLVASWSDGEPLVAFKGRRRVDLGFYPVSDSANCYQCDIGRWVSTTDGAILMADALEYVGGFTTLTPNAGTASPEGTVDISLSVVADVIRPGSYRTDLIISSNDPARRVDTIPVSLTVPNGPNLLASKTSLDFGDVYVGFPDTLALRIYNNGSAPLSVSGFTVSNPRFLVLGPSVFSVVPGQFQDLRVRFLPTLVGADTGTLAISSNDAADPTVSVFLQGKGLLTPNISFSADSIFSTVPPGGTNALSLTVYNPGATDLKFSTFISRTAPAGALLLRNGIASLTPLETTAAVPGQVIRAMPPDGNPKGLAFLGGHLWQIKAMYPGHGPSDGTDSVIELDPYTGQKLSSFVLAEYDFYQGLTSDGTNLWVLRHSGNPFYWAEKYSPDGRLLASLSIPGTNFSFGALGLAFDGVALWCFVGNAASGFFFEHFTTSGTLLENIAVPFGALEFPTDMTWVNKHADGKLWVGNNKGPMTNISASQFKVTADPATLVRNIPIPNPNLTGYGNGITHDGENLYAAESDFINPPVVYVLDDGLDEFVSVQPDSGVIPAGKSAELTVSFDASTLASGLKPGDYRTHLVFSNNDPTRPQAVIPLHLSVTAACAAAKGDMDGDGLLKATDVVLELNCVFLGTGNCALCYADVNCSGNLTPTDVVLELKAVFLGRPFPCSLAKPLPLEIQGLIRNGD
ncbi:MAG: choice-of-anchor D domain-containing protein [Candidatus Zixiibacteriota bacterium]